MPIEHQRSSSAEFPEDELTGAVIGCAIKVHRHLGNVLTEKAYEHFLTHDLVRNGFTVARQVVLPVTYEGMTVDFGYRPDLVINGELIVELKTVAQLLPVHTAQLLTYLRLTRIERGLLMNFHAYPLSSGIKRVTLKSST